MVEEEEERRRTRRKEVEQGVGEARRKHQGSGKQGVERKQKSQGQKPMLRKVSVQEEEELLGQGPLMITKVSRNSKYYLQSGVPLLRTTSPQVFFAVSLCLFLTTSTLLVSDYKQKDSLALRQAVGKLPLNWQICIVNIVTKFNQDQTDDSQMSST